MRKMKRTLPLKSVETLTLSSKKLWNDNEKDDGDDKIEKKKKEEGDDQN